MTDASALVAQHGGCHCGAVRWQVQAPLHMEVLECNCSLCSMSGFLHWIVPATHFHLLQGAAQLREYRFNTGTARHLYCGHCGVKSYYVPRSNPDGYDINVRCLDPDPRRVVTVQLYDGRNWEQGAAALAHLSR